MPILDVNEIRRILPHRYPMLLVDRIIELEAERIVGIKNVTGNEPFFMGHFPDFPVMPGVLIVEAMAQTAGVVVVHSLGFEREKRIVYFMTIEKARFRKPVHPGDMLRMPVRALRRRGPVWRFEGHAYVGDTLCAEAEFSAMIHDGAEVSDDSFSSPD